MQDFVAPSLAQSGNYEAALQAAFHAADDEVLKVCRETPQQDGNVSGAGATATVAIVKQNEVITANLGDSSAVLQRSGRQLMLSREHRVYGKCVSPHFSMFNLNLQGVPHFQWGRKRSMEELSLMHWIALTVLFVAGSSLVDTVPLQLNIQYQLSDCRLILFVRHILPRSTLLWPCRSKAAKAERKRVQDTGGWVSSDGRVCDVLAVSRAFGDAEFKGEGLSQLLADGVKARFWTQKFADAARFTSDPVIATPTVTYTSLGEELGDEFIVMGTDGLWYVPVFCTHAVFSSM